MNTKRSQVLTILAFPIVLAIGIVLIPVVTDYTDHHLAEEAVAQTGRWFLGHIISAVGFCLALLAVSSIDAHLRGGLGSLPKLTLPFTAIGAGFYAAGLEPMALGRSQFKLRDIPR